MLPSPLTNLLLLMSLCQRVPLSCFLHVEYCPKAPPNHSAFVQCLIFAQAIPFFNPRGARVRRRFSIPCQSPSERTRRFRRMFLEPNPAKCGQRIPPIDTGERECSRTSCRAILPQMRRIRRMLFPPNIGKCGIRFHPIDARGKAVFLILTLNLPPKNAANSPQAS